VAGSCKYSDEAAGSGATELVFILIFFLEVITKITSQDNSASGQYFNTGSPEYEAEILSIRQRRSV
jgi:hypothetical protein